MANFQVMLFSWSDDASDQEPKTEIAKDSSDTASPAALFSFNGVDFAFDDRQFINLTQMWKAAGSKPSMDPRQWRRKEGQGFIADLARSLNVPVGHIIVAERGRYGATHAHWQISVAYAKYLSHEFHRIVNEAFRRQLQEEIDPGLKVERGIEGYRRKGWTADRIEERVEGILERNLFTESLSAHGVSGKGYSICTDAINKPILGHTAKEFKEEKGLKKYARTRDHLGTPELAALRFAESMARQLMDLHKTKGNAQSSGQCSRAGKAVADLRTSLGLTG